MLVFGGVGQPFDVRKSHLSSSTGGIYVGAENWSEPGSLEPVNYLGDGPPVSK